MAEFDIVIKNGMIIDGTRAPRFRSDVGIKDGYIVKIGRLSPSDASTVLDAGGLMVVPGFIDLHTHYDSQVFWDPYCTLSGWHGVTSVAIGNCGFGFAPVKPEDRERAMLSMTRVEAIPLASMRAGMPWDWVSFPEFLNSLERTPKALNMLPYVPAGPLLTYVMGFEDAKAGRKPTQAEERAMCGLLNEAMDAGGCGWSAQRLPPTGPAAAQRDFDGTPMPTDVMHSETCLAFARVLGERNEGFMQITYVSGDPKADARHFEELAEVSGRPVLYNVVQAHDDRPNVHRNALKWLDRCRTDGLRVYGQGQTTDAGFTFTFEEWNLFDDSEPWCEATTGTTEERLAKLADPARRAALREQLPQAATGPLQDVTIIAARTPETKPYDNFTVGEVGERLGKHFVDAMLDIAVADQLKTLFFVNPPNVSLVHLQEVLDNEFVLLGISDGGAHTKFLTAGRYPTETITKIVREHEMISLEHAHWRLAALPAMYAGFRDRGVIREGAPADIVIYDFENLRITPTETVYDLPGDEWRRIQRAEGYRWVLVNGEITIEDDKETGASPGKLLRHGG